MKDPFSKRFFEKVPANLKYTRTIFTLPLVTFVILTFKHSQKYNTKAARNLKPLFR